MTLKKLIKEYENLISSESPRADCEFIIGEALGLSRFFVLNDKDIFGDDLKKVKFFLDQRVQKIPIAYILGYKYFYKYKFLVNKNVLIPRPETEILVEKTMELAGLLDKKNIQILDIGCGSGCIGLSLILDLDEAHLCALDNSQKALDVTLENAKKYSVNHRVEFVCEEAASVNFPKAFDVIVANPPYIDRDDKDISLEVVGFEPHSALFAQKNGLDCLFDWSVTASRCLAEDGFYMLEVGWNQALKVKEFIEREKIFGRVDVMKDYSEIQRFLICKEPLLI